MRPRPALDETKIVSRADDAPEKIH